MASILQRRSADGYGTVAADSYQGVRFPHTASNRNIGKPLPNVGDDARKFWGTSSNPGDVQMSHRVTFNKGIDNQGFNGMKPDVPAFARDGDQYYTGPVEFDQAPKDIMPQQAYGTDNGAGIPLNVVNTKYHTGNDNSARAVVDQIRRLYTNKIDDQRQDVFTHDGMHGSDVAGNGVDRREARQSNRVVNETYTNSITSLLNGYGVRAQQPSYAMQGPSAARTDMNPDMNLKHQPNPKKRKSNTDEWKELANSRPNYGDNPAGNATNKADHSGAIPSGTNLAATGARQQYPTPSYANT